MIEQDSQYKDQYIPVGAVRGLGDQRNNFEKWCDQEYGENNWEMVHVLEIHGEEVYLTNQEFFEHIYVPAMFNWINQNFPFMPSLLLEVASSVYEYAPEDALPFIRYDENGHAEFDTDQTDMPLGFPGQAPC